ncbi:MAG: chorismate synthase, partial [Niameybacter sp.]
MSGSIFGKHFSVSTFGESHGLAIGVIIDGCPSNIPLTKEDIMKNMVRRKPGNAKVATARKESDAIDILSGVFEGKTTGTPICL